MRHGHPDALVGPAHARAILARGVASATGAPAAPEPWPEAAIALPSAVTSAPSLPPGYQCHPCHFLAENQLFGVGSTPAGLIAVGVQQPPAQAVAFSSTDGTSWVPLGGFTGASGTAAVAVATDGSRIVIVGHDTSGATSWATAGGAWTAAPRQDALLVPYSAGGMTSVAVAGEGFVAGGFHDDPLHATASAAAWWSSDGLAWRADDGSGTFAGGRILGIAARGGTVVAVGTDGDPNYGPAAAWRWTAAAGWERGRIGPDDGGAMRAVAATADGFVAVGLNGDDDGARVWLSPDGRSWTVVPDQPAFHYYTSPVRMQSIAVVPDGLVVGGWRSDEAKGSALTWTSTDGRSWPDPTWQPSFSGGQIDGMTIAGRTAVAVGRTGYPDWNQATIWTAPAP